MTYILSKSTRKDKKYQLKSPQGKISYFGSSKYSDYTRHKDPQRKENYIARHGATQKHLWTHTKTNLMTPSYLARYVLWNKPTLKDSIKDIENKQGIKIIKK